MTASEDCSPLIASEATDALVLRMTPVSTVRQESVAVFLWPFRVWVGVLRAFDSMIQPLKTWMCLERDISELRGLDYRELHDIGINRLDIAAIRAGTYKRASSDNAERIVFCPEAGKPVTRTPTKHDPGSPAVRWDERPPRIIIWKAWNITRWHPSRRVDISLPASLSIIARNR